MATAYSLGCIDKDGNPLHDDHPIGPPKNRIFNPNDSPCFTADSPLPGRILIKDERYRLTHLRFADEYRPKRSDRYEVTPDGMKVVRDTMVVEVGSIVREGITVAARTFAPNSPNNQPGMPALDKSRAKATTDTIIIGCQKIEGMLRTHRFIKKVIFMTYEKSIYNGIPKLHEWLTQGFPTTFEDGMGEMDFKFLYHNITHLEEKGVNVLFWLVNPEHVIGPHYVANTFFNSIAGIESDGSCDCPDCISATQSRETAFAYTGKPTCPCGGCREIVRKYGHLKKGEMFPMTNNAGVVANLTMEEDGTTAVRLAKKERKERKAAAKARGKAAA